MLVEELCGVCKVGEGAAEGCGALVGRCWGAGGLLFAENRADSRRRRISSDPSRPSSVRY